MQINQNKRKQRLILLSFVASIVLCFLKFSAYYLTDSNAILSDALESIINVIASGFAFYSIRLSAQPKDDNHPYGHGKVEFFSAGFEGALIVIASFYIIYEAILRLITPEPMENLGYGAILIVITIVANSGIGFLLVKEGKKSNSLALTADGKHLLSDSISSVVLILSVGLIILTGLEWIDSIASLLFGLFLIYSGTKIVRQSVSLLMDATDPQILNKIVDILWTNRKPHWIDLHNLRVQQYGADLHIDCHLTLPYYWQLADVHGAVHAFENILKANNSSETEIFVHADPCLPECCSFCRIANCPVRKFPFKEEIIWTADRIVKNEKLFNIAKKE